MTTSSDPVEPALAPGPGARPTWHRLSECPRCIAYRPNLVRTAFTAVVVGILLFLINHLARVLEGRTSTGTWVDTGLSFVVPFCVANIGLLLASRRDTSPAGGAGGGGGGGGGGTGSQVAAGRTWQRVRDVTRFVLRRRNLRRTLTIALVVGSVYFAINQLDVVVRGQATTQVWISTALTYLVPFTVSNVGLRVGSRELAT